MLCLLAALSPLMFRLQVSDDDSYISDVSDSISMDTYSNEGGSERHNSGTRYSYTVASFVCVCLCVCVGTYQVPQQREKTDTAKRPYSVKNRQGLSARAHWSVTVTKPLCTFFLAPNTQQISENCKNYSLAQKICWTWLLSFFKCLQTRWFIILY